MDKKKRKYDIERVLFSAVTGRELKNWILTGESYKTRIKNRVNSFLSRVNIMVDGHLYSEFEVVNRKEVVCKEIPPPFMGKGIYQKNKVKVLDTLVGIVI